MNKGREFITKNMDSLCLRGEISVQQLLKATRVLFLEENNSNVKFLQRGMLSVREYVRLVNVPETRDVSKI
jgi:hypothetical protein